MPRSDSRSPPRKGRRRSLVRSPSPPSHRLSSRRRRDHRSRSPPLLHSHGRRKSRSISPRRVKRRSHSRSPVHKSGSPSLISVERKRALDKACADEELETKRCQQEAELKLIEEETSRRVEEEIRKQVQEALNTEELRKEIEMKFEEGREKIFDEIAGQLESEKEQALAEARKKEEQVEEKKGELDRMLEENQWKIDESQRRAAEEQLRKEEERYRELEALQHQKEEALRRKKLEEDQGRVEQMKILGKKNTRPKLSFAFSK